MFPRRRLDDVGGHTGRRAVSHTGCRYRTANDDGLADAGFRQALVARLPAGAGDYHITELLWRGADVAERRRLAAAKQADGG